VDPIQRARRRIARVCSETRTPTALLHALREALAPLVPADRWCGLTFDPATTLPTGGVHHEGVAPARVPRLLELEFGGGDINGFADLARRPLPAATLSAATGGRHDASARYRDVFAPEGLQHELRAVFRDEAGAWGGLVLLRGRGARDFSAEETALLAHVSKDACRALRGMLLRAEALGDDGTDGPGLLLLRGAGLALDYANPAAARWLEEIDDCSAGHLPYALHSLALRARHGDGHARARMRTRAGRWLTAHAEAMPDGCISLILEPSRPHEIAQVLAAAYGLTAREAEVVRCVAAGHANAEIARQLGVSRYTVEDHLRNVYAKLAVGSRAALIAKLFHDHYLPRAEAGTAIAGHGGFAR